MNDSLTVERQATFNTDPPEERSGNVIRRGDIEIPIVDDLAVDNSHRPPRATSQQRTDALKGANAFSSSQAKNKLHNGLAEKQDFKSQSPLSLSIRNKLKKKPKIKIPRLKYDSSQPTIFEETSQDFLDIDTSDSTEKGTLSPTSTASSSNGKRKSVSFDLTPTTLDREPLLSKSRDRPLRAPANSTPRGSSKPSPQTNTRTSNATHKVDASHKKELHVSLESSRRRNSNEYNSDDTNNKVKVKRRLSNSLENRLNQKQTINSEEKSVEESPASVNTESNEKNLRIKGILPSAGTSPKTEAKNMEHQTFEEVLQERNALAKSEKVYHKRIRQLEDELKAMVQQCEALSDENKELRQALEQEKKTDAGAASRLKQMDSVLLENAKLKSHNEELTKNTQDLEKQISSFKSKESKNSDLDSKNKELQTKVSELQKQNDVLKSKVSSLGDEKQVIATTLEEKRKELNELMRAMKSEASLETKLKESNVKLEKTLEEMDDVKKKLEETQDLLQESEGNVDKLKDNLAHKEKEVKKLKEEQASENKLILDLKESLDKSTEEIKKYKETKAALKALEKEAATLETKVSSLEEEVQKSKVEKEKLTKEKVEMGREVEKLQRECVSGTDAAVEVKKLTKRLETEREDRRRAETALSGKQEEVLHLESRLRETESRIEDLLNRLKTLEEINNELKSLDLADLNSSNKSLREENKKLKQMLVERNIELTNKNLEQRDNQTQILFLERKSKGAKVGVQTVSGSEQSEKRPAAAVTSSSSDKHNPRQPRNRAGNTNTSRFKPDPANPSKTVRSFSLDEPLDDLADDEYNKSAVVFPIIDSKTGAQLDHQSGYFSLYRDKMKRMKDKRY
ncbi:uncharacterized protein LOC131935165 [Physella acuta]|uniref:uncharacterized protein LOC131935165 n=1 Tax=Physella acuta TaxID=109671 RepID=UPI0027DD07F5|nr:uncharacterized protein LOC131935165 [Physella acuta]